MFVRSGSPSVWWPLNAGILAAVLTLLTDQLEGWGGRALPFVAVVAVTWGAVEVARRWAVNLAERRTGGIVEELAHAKERLIANVSHGLRTPLTGIVGFAHVLSDRVRDPDDREACSAILSQAAELGRIVDDLVTSARVDAGLVDVNPVEVWISEQLDRVVEFLDLLGVPVNVDCEEALIRVDPEKFRQVLRNLVVNAHQHGRPQVRVEGGVRGDRYVLSVVDRGPGVPVELQPVMFERFPDRPDRPIVGRVGLGLPVAQELCRMMDAEITYRRLNGETHFVLSVPLVAEANVPTRVTVKPERLVRMGDRLVRVPA
jgi:signal transduction histidine kinase